MTSDSRLVTRASGILLHVVSLPGGQGIGDLGREAYRFVDWLQAAGQQAWQVLPVGPPGYGGTPYASNSAFAGNLQLISLDRLVEEGLLRPDEVQSDFSEARVDYPAVAQFKDRALHVAFGRFRPGRSFSAFRARASYWLDDYVGIEGRRPNDEAYLRFVQFVFQRQWVALKKYANQRNVRIVGDIPIFVAAGSVDVKAHPELFHVDERGRPTLVAGVPPDYFSSTGQRWGNPLYRWDVMAREGFEWWRCRMRRSLELFDLVRIDHFRGFAASYAVPASHRTAVHGCWQRGPGAALFSSLTEALGKLPIVVEDLGLITPDVTALRDQLGYPGMKVLQFAFGDSAENPYLPHNYTSSNCVVYTGTHDNDTTKGWYESLPEGTKHRVRTYLGRDGSDISWDLVRLALSSIAGLAVIPVQDLLSLGSEARLNVPGRPHDNWAWRLQPGALNDEVACRLRDLAASYGRVPAPRNPPPRLPNGYPLESQP